MQKFPRLCCDIFLSMKSSPKHRLFNWLEFFDHLIFVFKEKRSLFISTEVISLFQVHTAHYENALILFGNVQALPFKNI